MVEVHRNRQKMPVLLNVTVQVICFRPPYVQLCFVDIH